MELLSDHADLMALLHPDYPTQPHAMNVLYEDHLERVVDHIRDKEAQAWQRGRAESGDVMFIGGRYVVRWIDNVPNPYEGES